LGHYYNIETAGYYRDNYWKEDEKIIWERSEPISSDTVADSSIPQTTYVDGGRMVDAEDQMSFGKDKYSSETSKSNEDYLTAVESGDIETAQRMVDEAAKGAGEIEARNVEARRNMTEAERRSSLNEQTEDTRRKDQNIRFHIRTKEAPKKTGIGYKVFYLKDGKLYPPMVANPNGEATPIGIWLDADAAPVAGSSKTGRPQVKAGGKGTQGGSGKLAYRPGWYLGEIPYAIQFNRKDENGEKTLFPNDFVWAEVEYAKDVDYQEEAHKEGINANGKYQHSLAGLKRVPEDGYYMYRTNPNPETDPWVITGSMKVNRRGRSWKARRGSIQVSLLMNLPEWKHLSYLRKEHLRI
jgi:hypothetical protein